MVVQNFTKLVIDFELDSSLVVGSSGIKEVSTTDFGGRVWPVTKDYLIDLVYKQRSQVPTY